MGLLRRRASSLSESTSGIDLAPMLDFVLNLLIFFIITAVFVKEYGLTVNRPGGRREVAAGEGPSSALVLTILASGELAFEGRIIDPRAVRANVERARAATPERGVLIIAAAEAPTGLVVQAVDQIHLAGVYDVTFATTE